MGVKDPHIMVVSARHYEHYDCDVVVQHLHS